MRGTNGYGNWGIRCGRQAGGKGRKTVAGEGGWMEHGGREGGKEGEQIDAANPCHLAITRRCGFAPENTADPPSPATHASLSPSDDVCPGPQLLQNYLNATSPKEKS